MVPVKAPVALRDSRDLHLWWNDGKGFFSGMPSKYFFGMEVTSNGSFGDPMNSKMATFFCNSLAVRSFWNFWHLLLFLSSSSLCVGGKINMDPLPGKFLTVPVALNFLKHCPNGRYGHFKVKQIFYYCHSHALWNSTHLFPHLICAFSYLSYLDVWVREYGLCVTSYV